MINQIIFSIIFSSMLLSITPAIAEDALFSFENPSVLDTVSGNSVNTVTIGGQYMINTDITNHKTTAQDFAYTVQITNVDDGTELANAMLQGSLEPGQEFTLSLPWEPASCGNFIANFEIFDNIPDGNSLSVPLSLPITIEGCESENSPLGGLFENIQEFFVGLFS
ncbi:hypothetical protein [Nitrosopumilus sp.]|uniref:hypothetical protein n=1 Tax=Nitrosopumilus sp. TaxID=2024843 RepID=UPI002632A06B|nr:hypothetical protein [Nitrosopumilus sp.]